MLATSDADVQILSCPLEHRNFPKLIDLIRIYFSEYGIKGDNCKKPFYRNSNGFPIPSTKEHREHLTDARQDPPEYREHEAEIEKNKNVFLAFLRDIKKAVDNRDLL